MALPAFTLAARVRLTAKGNGLNGILQSFNHAFEFRNRGAEGWDEDDDVANGAEEEASAAAPDGDSFRFSLA
jgi:hypothetical protein